MNYTNRDNQYASDNNYTQGENFNHYLPKYNSKGCTDQLFQQTGK